MSYIKLDRTSIKYQSQVVTRGGLIVSQIIESKISPGIPTLISSEEELELYFGKSFPQREYFSQLISENMTLHLVTPIKEDEKEVPIIDTSGYTIITTVKDKDGDLEIPLRYSDQLPEIGEPGVKYYVSEESEYYVYLKVDDDFFGWTSISKIPKKEMNRYSKRDNLRLVNSGWSKENSVSWCWMDPEGGNPEYNPDTESILHSIKTSGEEDHLGFILDFSGVGERIRKVEDSEWTYLIFPVPVSLGGRIQFYMGSPLNPDIINTKEENRYQIPDLPLEEQISFIIEILRKYEWSCIPKTGEGLTWELYNIDLLPDLGFYNIPGLVFSESRDVTHNVLSMITEGEKRVEFFSKTLGSEEDIKISISKLPGKTEYYRVIVSRYSMQEVFEGPLYLEYSEDYEQYLSLEKIINIGSSLITIKVYRNRGDGTPYLSINEGDGLPEGDYTLSRATPIGNWSPDDYWRGLEALSESDISEEFLFIPEMEKFLKVGVEGGKTWYSEYENLLEYASKKNCQVLITNGEYKFGCTSGMDPSKLDEALPERPESPDRDFMYLIKDGDWINCESWDGENWRVWGTTNPDNLGRWPEIKETFSDSYTGNHIFNYTKDLDNRLVYFFRDMTYSGWSRPGWHIFLESIASGNYLLEVDDIIYDSPAKFYTEEENNLESYKSNYLSDNGHIFYYRKLFSHPGDWKYNTSILGRCCIDIVSNTLSREMRAYLDLDTIGEITKGFQELISGIKKKYPIIYSLYIDHIEENYNTQSISVYLMLGIRETLDKDVKLSVTLNFNLT